MVGVCCVCFMRAAGRACVCIAGARVGVVSPCQDMRVDEGRHKCTTARCLFSPPLPSPPRPSNLRAPCRLSTRTQGHSRLSGANVHAISPPRRPRRPGARVDGVESGCVGRRS